MAKGTRPELFVDVTNPRSPVAIGFFAIPDLPSIGDVLVTADLSVILSSEISLTGGGKAVIIGGLSSIGFGPMRLFVADNALTSIGSRMALTQDGILVSSDRVYVSGVTTSENGVHTAALGSLAMIEKVTPAMVQVDKDGNSIEPMTITYRFIAPPPNAGAASIAIYRNDQNLGRYPVAQVADGRYELTVPAGIAFAPPPGSIEISLAGADGSAGAPLVTEIEDGDVASGFASLTSYPAFESATPGAVAAGSGSVRVKITGQNLGGVANVFVRDESGESTTVDIATRDATSISVDLPDTLLADPGFVLLAPGMDEARGIAFLVGDPAIPTRGSAVGVQLTAVTPTELGLDDRALVLGGTGFAEGMAVVIGREGTGGVALPSTVNSDQQIEADLAGGFLGRADDLYVAVLSADGIGLSPSLPLKSKATQRPFDYSGVIPAGQSAITSIHGAITWRLGQAANDQSDEEQIDLEGIGLTPGMQVMFAPAAGPSGQQRVRPTRPSTTPSTISRVTTNVPKDLTAWPTYHAALEPQYPQRLSVAGPRSFASIRPVEIPLGGRKKLGGFRRDGDDHVYVVSYPDPSAGQLTCPLWSPKTDDSAPWKKPPARLAAGGSFTALDGSAYIGFSLTSPETDHPWKAGTGTWSRVPLVSEENNPCEPTSTDGGYYLRGVRLPQSGELATLRVTGKDAQGNTLSNTVRVTVVAAQLGEAKTTPQVEKLILDTAGESGVPPQFLKSQIETETDFHPERYRYEPMTIDFAHIGYEGADLRTNTYVQRHLRSGAVASLNDQAECIVIVGPNAQPAAADTQGCRTEQVSAAADQTEFPQITGAVGDSHVRGRRGLPLTSKGDPNPGYRVFEVGAVRRVATTPVPDPVTLGFVEPPYWSLAETRTSQKVTQEMGTDATAKAAKFQFDYATNTLTLGRALLEKEWVKFSFRTLRTDTIGGGTCGGYDVTKLNGRTKPIGARTHVFRANHTIGGWVTSNVQNFGGYNFLNGTESEKRIQFHSTDGTNPGPTNPQIVDRRLDQTLAQFVAAGSFGLTQASVLSWNHPRAATLNQVFDLNSRCLYDLGEQSNPNRDKESVRFAAAYHSYHAYGPGTVPKTVLSGRTWDQFEWARWWSRVFNRYNPGPKYCVRGEVFEDRTNGDRQYLCWSKKNGWTTDCKCEETDGMSFVVKKGLEDYTPDTRKTR